MKFEKKFIRGREGERMCVREGERMFAREKKGEECLLEIEQRERGKEREKEWSKEECV